MIVNKDNETIFQAKLTCARKMVQISEAKKNLSFPKAIFYCKVFWLFTTVLLIKMNETGENCGALVALV